MKYLVMETHPAYAVLLDEEGRYLKAANLRYQVGDTVEDVIPLREPAPKTVKLGRPLAGLAAMAACLCLIFFGYYQPNFTAYGTLRIQINPDVEMTISRTERVLALEGLNQDGMDLIEGYDYQGKRRDAATEELVERAIDMGYLSGGNTISITVSSSDAAWQAQEEAQVRQALEDRYGQQVVIRIGGENDDGPPEASPPQQAEVMVPVPPQPPAPAGTDRPDDDTGYGPDNDGVTDYDDTDYGPNNDGVTDYDDIDYGPNNDGVTGSDDTDYGPNNDGDTPYDPYRDGITDYEDRDGASDGEDDDNAGDDDNDDGNDDDNAGDDNTDDGNDDDSAGDDDTEDGDDEDSAGDDDTEDGDDEDSAGDDDVDGGDDDDSAGDDDAEGGDDDDDIEDIDDTDDADDNDG